jgi:site-specific DNA recombinase
MGLRTRSHSHDRASVRLRSSVERHLLRLIARGRAWLEAVASGVETAEEIAARHKCSVRHVNMMISMDFIAPSLVKATVDGGLPRGVGIV